MASDSILAKMAVYISANTAEFNKQLALTNNKLASFEKAINSSASNIARAFGFTGGIIAIKGIIQTLAGFEAEMANVKAVTNASESEFKQLRTSALNLAESLGVTTKGVAALETQYARLGFSTEEILLSTKAAIQLSRATGEDVAIAAMIAGSTLRSFGLDAKEMNRIADVMAKSFNNTALGLSDFGEAIKYVAPVAANANITLEQTVAMLGVLADAGIKGSMAGTSLRKIISDLGKGAGPVLTKALSEMAAKGLTGAQAMDEVGRTAYASLLILSKNTEKIEAQTKALYDSKGALDAVAAVVKDDLTGDWEKFNSEIDVTIQRGGGVIPILRSIVEIMRGGVQQLGGAGAKITDHWFLDALGIPTNEQLEKKQNELDIALNKIKASFGKESTPYVSPLIIDFAKSISKGIKEIGDSEKLLLPPLETERVLQERLKELNEIKLGQVGSLRAATNSEIESIQRKIKSLQELGIANAKSGQRADMSKYGYAQDKPEEEGINPVVSSFNSLFGQQIAEDTKAVSERIKVNDGLHESLLKINKDFDNQRLIMNQVGQAAIAFGEGFGSVVSGAQTAAQAFGQYASQIVAHIGRMIMAKMIDKALDDPATNVNFFAKLALIGVAIGTAEALIHKIGSTSGGSSSVASSRVASSSYARGADTMHITFDPLRFSGSDFTSGVRKIVYQSGKIG